MNAPPAAESPNWFLNGFDPSTACAFDMISIAGQVLPVLPTMIPERLYAALLLFGEAPVELNSFAVEPILKPLSRSNMVSYLVVAEPEVPFVVFST